MLFWLSPQETWRRVGWTGKVHPGDQRFGGAGDWSSKLILCMETYEDQEAGHMCASAVSSQRPLLKSQRSLNVASRLAAPESGSEMQFFSTINMYRLRNPAWGPFCHPSKPVHVILVHHDFWVSLFRDSQFSYLKSQFSCPLESQGSEQVELSPSLLPSSFHPPSLTLSFHYPCSLSLSFFFSYKLRLTFDSELIVWHWAINKLRCVTKIIT